MPADTAQSEDVCVGSEPPSSIAYGCMLGKNGQIWRLAEIINYKLQCIVKVIGTVVSEDTFLFCH
jgi:hypothetical protein